MSARVLTPLRDGSPTQKDFLAYDFEWWPETPETIADGRAYRLRIASFFDGKRHVSFAHHGFADPRPFKSENPIVKFLDVLLRPKYSGYRFYAHWGGIADNLFLFQAIHDLGYATKIIVNGSSAAIILVESCGRGCKEACSHKRHTWTFVDSSFLFRFGLAKLAKLLGMKKGGDGETTWETESDTDLCTYNQHDNAILYEALRRMLGVSDDMGARLGMTMAATSIDLFRRRYLKDDISTPDVDNDFSKRAYYASRVEAYRFSMPHGYAYDVNSSFVYSMTFPLPGSPIAEDYGVLPKKGLYIADVDVSVPDMYLPPLPYRDTDNRLFFPTGDWSGVFTSVDIELALRVGCKIRGVRRVLTYEERDDLGDFARDVYAKRIEASDKFLYTAIKLLGNGAYGKFGEAEEKTEYLMHPTSTLCERHYYTSRKGGVKCVEHKKADCKACYAACSCLVQISPGIWRYDNRREIQHRHTQIGAFITSIARRTLYEGQYSYAHLLHYSDTDSLHLSGRMCPENHRGHLTHTDANSDVLGGFKFEGERRDMTYVAPKIYGGKDEKGDPLLAAKGFRIGGKTFDASLGREVYSKEAQERFAAIVRGDAVEDSRMVRPKEYLSKLDRVTRPYDVPIGVYGKKLSLLNRPKRKGLGNNNTRPWTVEEIRDGR